MTEDIHGIQRTMELFRTKVTDLERGIVLTSCLAISATDVGLCWSILLVIQYQILRNVFPNIYILIEK